MTRLRAAERLSNAVVSVDRQSVPIESNKLVAIGHGVDLSRFSARKGQGHHGLVAIALGRYAPSKGLTTVIQAAGLARAAGLDLQLKVLGPTVTEAERLHKTELVKLVSDLQLEGTVLLGGAVEYHCVPDLLASADVLVSSTSSGSADKVVFEAAASATLVICSSHVFDSLLEGFHSLLRFRANDATDLAERLLTVAALPYEQRDAIGRELQHRVAENHSVGTWADRLLQLASGPDA
jgi:glycosyltransferase involved in cell wall biosynthesis